MLIGLAPVAPAGAQSTNDFRISSYAIQYELSRDGESRSVLKTTETITAEFPSYDQNHGLERALPATYDGHSTSLDILKVSDANGAKRAYSVNESNGVKVLRIGDADKYVHGTQTYRIVYAQRDVTRFFQNTNRDEWYWDTNGTEWGVPIDSLTVNVIIDDALVSHREGAPVCYQGFAGSSDRCIVEETNTGYIATATDISAGENITVAFGFTPGTFATYKPSLFEILFAIWIAVQIVSGILTVILLITFGVLYGRRRNRVSEEKPTPAEYIPPKDASVSMAAQVVSVMGSVFSAQLIDLAVRRFISIVETRPKSTWRMAEYDIVIEKDVSGLLDEEVEVLSDMFGHAPKVGEKMALSSLKNNSSYSRRVVDNGKKLQTLVESTYGLREKSPVLSRFFYRWAGAMGIVALLTLSFAFGFSALILWVYGYVLRPLTDKGLALRRYILGLDVYIKASETERLAFLQGPDTAEKIGYSVDPNKPGDLVKLYERTLPYAILFGREREWAKRLGEFYGASNTAPDWYSGTAAFNAAMFTSTLQSFTTATTYSSGSSSSSGGSSGGGSSGGGGGGGGGGGW